MFFFYNPWNKVSLDGALILLRFLNYQRTDVVAAGKILELNKKCFLYCYKGAQSFEA